jgi:hypothetical protein
LNPTSKVKQIPLGNFVSLSGEKNKNITINQPSLKEQEIMPT